tara:strand:+ start:387 stop:695 length:309 start_codon:yes stop_codon:yes gene_type:complete
MGVRTILGHQRAGNQAMVMHNDVGFEQLCGEGLNLLRDSRRILFYHVLQVNPKDGFGWFDEEESRDWGKLYKLKLDLLEDIPEYDYRIVQRSTIKTWEEVTR